MPTINVDKRDRRYAFLLVGTQGLVTIVISVLGWIHSRDAAISLLIGGGICTLGSGWLAFVGFRPSATRPAKEILASFYLGEIGKFLLVMILFILAFKKVAILKEPHNALLMFLAFIVVQSVVWLAPQLIKAR